MSRSFTSEYRSKDSNQTFNLFNLLNIYLYIFFCVHIKNTKYNMQRFCPEPNSY